MRGWHDPTKQAQLETATTRGAQRMKRIRSVQYLSHGECRCTGLSSVEQEPDNPHSLIVLGPASAGTQVENWEHLSIR